MCCSRAANAALLPETLFIDAGRASEECLPRRDRENRRRKTEFLVGRFAEMLLDYFDLTRIAQVGLLEDKDDVLQPLLVHKSEQLPGGRTPWIDDRKDKQDEIGTRDKILRDRLMLGDHRVGAGRIDDVEVLEKFDRLIALGHVCGDVDVLFARTVLKNVNPIGRGQNIDFAKLLTKERIEKGGLARLHFSHHDEKERLTDVLEQVLQSVEQRGLTLHIGRQLEQRGESRLRPAAKLQIKIGDHAVALRIRQTEGRGSSGDLLWRRGGETRRGNGRRPFRTRFLRRHRLSHRDQLGNGDKLEPFGLELVERARHRLDRPRVDIVRENDRAGARFPNDAARHDSRARSFPIERIHVPKDDAITKFRFDPLFSVAR